MHALLTSPSPVARDLSHRIYQRRLYKRALYLNREQVNAARMAQYCSHRKRVALAGRIADIAGVLPHEVLVDIPPFPGDMSLHVQVKNRHRAVGISELSPLLHTLNDTRRGQWRLGVYAPSRYRERVADVAADVLNVRPETTQEQLFG